MWTLTKKLKYFADSLVAFSYMPIRLMQIAGGLIALLGFAWAVLILMLKLRNDIPIRGWTALMVVVLVLGGLQLLTLGVIGEYVWRTLDEAKGRPLYVVERVLGGAHG
jgi:dolichol-phosphate mannosyltransferase